MVSENTGSRPTEVSLAERRICVHFDPALIRWLPSWRDPIRLRWLDRVTNLPQVMSSVPHPIDSLLNVYLQLTMPSAISSHP